MAFNVMGAKQAGYSDQEINQYLAAKGGAITPQTPAAPKEEGFDWTSLLPIIGGIGGSFIPGLGNIVGGALGAGAGTLLKGGIKGDIDPKEIVKETALGGVGGVIGKGLGKVASKILPKFGGAVERGGQSIALKALRPTKTQFANFAEKHGEDLGEYISKKNPLTGTDLIGKTGQQIGDEVLDPLQQSFNTIVNSVDVPVEQGTIVKKFAEKIAELRNTGSSEDLRLADDLLNEAKTVLDQLNRTGNSVAAVNKMRINFDSKVNNWLGNPIEAGKNRLTGSILREAVQDTADSAGLTGPGGVALKDMGIELSKLYSVKDIADLQANLGRGTLPLGLSRLLGIAAGGAVMGGGLPGAAAGLMGTVALNSPSVLRGMAKGAIKAGPAISEGLPQPFAQIASQGAGQASARIGGETGAGAASAYEGDPSQLTPETASLPTPARGTAPTDQLSQIKQIYGMALLSKAKSASDIKAAFDLLTPATPKKTNRQGQFEAASEGAQHALALLSSGKVSSGPIRGRIAETVGATTGGISDEQQDYQATIALSRSALLNAFLGGAIPMGEYQRISAGIPTITDPTNIAKQKLTTLIRELNRFADSGGEYVSETTIPTISASGF